MRFPWRARFLTVVATDIVGSTRTLLELGDRAWRETLETHNEIVRHHLRQHDGAEAAWRGDGFLLTFDSADKAVRCACIVSLEIERLRLSIRAGIHAGSCRSRRDKCSAPIVARAIAIMERAEPGEVLVTPEALGACASATSAVRDVDGAKVHVLDRSSIVS